jgi:hypothetical protein
LRMSSSVTAWAPQETAKAKALAAMRMPNLFDFMVALSESLVVGFR